MTGCTEKGPYQKKSVQVTENSNFFLKKMAKQKKKRLGIPIHKTEVWK